MADKQKLQALRARIDKLDEQIQALINERGEVAQEVARLKESTGKDTAFYRPEREAQVLREVLARNKGPIPGEEMARLFREIMSVCLALEQPLTIAYLGPEGTFTQAAALKHFGHSVTTLPLGAIDEVFREVESGSAQYGVVPVENSTEGVVNHTLDRFMISSLKICGEVELRVHQHLMGAVNDISEIKRVYSHQQSLAQCREWLDENLSGVERVAVSSNAKAARIAKDEPGAAAIAGDIAASIYGLNILRNNIEDWPDNTTRFLIIGHQDTPPSGSDKTSLLVSTMNKPGALHRLLNPLAANNISMSRIESRPSRMTMWDYVFFIDIEGHKDDKQVARALAELEKEAAMLKILGSYPKAVM
ncbi:MAG: prephenate dehydratase [Gammaproteobacteria bacterium]|nr:prephenate dehydratase [Gammaproteobacteria bacterium]